MVFKALSVGAPFAETASCSRQPDGCSGLGLSWLQSDLSSLLPRASVVINAHAGQTHRWNHQPSSGRGGIDETLN